VKRTGLGMTSVEAIVGAEDPGDSGPETRVDHIRAVKGRPADDRCQVVSLQLCAEDAVTLGREPLYDRHPNRSR